MLHRNHVPSSGNVKITFTASSWQHPGAGGWHFVSLPMELSEEIRSDMQSQEEGWGRMKVKAQIGETSWATSIWFDTKQNTYLLPLKAEIRKKEGLIDDKMMEVIIWV